jgi:ligand-binding sensor domain-containing protein
MSWFPRPRRNGAVLRFGSQWSQGTSVALVCFCLAVSKSVGAAPAIERWSNVADTVFQHPETDIGMNNRIVTAIAQDRIGFLWVGTQDGLARWMGMASVSIDPIRRTRLT